MNTFFTHISYNARLTDLWVRFHLWYASHKILLFLAHIGGRINRNIALGIADDMEEWLATGRRVEKQYSSLAEEYKAWMEKNS